ncbi:MAG TPA: hypothetical protein VFG68_08245 [Fimbriiglobus sp.]|nr:hypothetical protein [Fimbriiglobus sp.]
MGLGDRLSDACGDMRDHMKENPDHYPMALRNTVTVMEAMRVVADMGGVPFKLPEPHATKLQELLSEIEQLDVRRIDELLADLAPRQTE